MTIYILMIWTAVAATDVRGGSLTVKYDWRPIGEFHATDPKPGQELCESAARQLGIQSDRYRCVRSR